jgi:hypothetical protein
MRKSRREDLSNALLEPLETRLEVSTVESTTTTMATRSETLPGCLTILLVVMNNAGIALKGPSALLLLSIPSLVKLVTCALTALASLTLVLPVHSVEP